jgi:hypothetical protein
VSAVKNAGIILLALIIIGATIYFATDGFTFTPTESSKPTFQIDIRSNTEYYDGDSGKILTLLTDLQGRPVNALCTASITYPNQSFFIQNGATTATSLGSYELTFTAPSIEGVYEYVANCTFNGRTMLAGKSFHISNSTNIILNSIKNGTIALEQAMSDYNISITNTIQTEATNTNNLITSTNASLSSQISTFSDTAQANFTQLLTAINNLNTSVTLNNLSTQITDVTLLIQSFQNQTQLNFSQVINLLLATNQSINSNVDEAKLLIQQANASLSTQITNLQLYLDAEHTSTNNQIQAMNTSINNKLDQILGFLNTTTSDINVYANANDCFVGQMWLINVQVSNQFGAPYSSPPMYCNLTTDRWGFTGMTYNGYLRLFQYTHVCDSEGQIAWSVSCDK